MSLAKFNTPSAAREAYERIVGEGKRLNAVITAVKPQDNPHQEGKLAHIPVALKDNISTKGILTTAASAILDDYIPAFNATVVEKLEAAGAIIVAKASMDELAMGSSNRTAAIGPCHNPYDLARIPGGSSGGSAALVAGGIVPLALGTDTGDSIRKPAAYCGIVGVKPTYGRISRYGVIPYASSLDHVGYFVTNVADAALALEVLAGRDDKDMTSGFAAVPEYHKLLKADVKGKKIAILEDIVNAIKDQRIVDSFRKAVASLKAKGAEITPVYFNHDLLRAMFPTYSVIANAEATANQANLDGIRFGHRVEGETMEEIMINTRTRGFSANIKRRFIIGSYSLNEANQEKILKKAWKVRRLVSDAFNLKLAQFDALMAPAAPTVAPLIEETKAVDRLSDEYLIAENYLVYGNFMGLPSLTLPLDLIDGLPIGLNITTNLFTEETLFNIALAMEEITGLKDLVKEDF